MLGESAVTQIFALSELGWGKMLVGEDVATAILDRPLHHSHVVTIKGEHYRLKEKRRAGMVPNLEGAGSRPLPVGRPSLGLRPPSGHPGAFIHNRGFRTFVVGGVQYF